MTRRLWSKCKLFISFEMKQKRDKAKLRLKRTRWVQPTQDTTLAESWRPLQDGRSACRANQGPGLRSRGRVGGRQATPIRQRRCVGRSQGRAKPPIPEQRGPFHTNWWTKLRRTVRSPKARGRDTIFIINRKKIKVVLRVFSRSNALVNGVTVH